MNLFYGDMLPPPRAEQTAKAAGGVLVGTASPVRLRVDRLEHHLTPPGAVCIASFLGDRLISRCAVPEETAEEFLAMELFDKPVSLALSVRRAEPGVVGNLLALVAFSEAGPAEEAEPWRHSVPGAGYDTAHSREAGDRPLVGVFLGQVVRFEEDRRHPDDLLKEATDMLAGVVRGRIGNLVDRLIRDLGES